MNNPLATLTAQFLKERTYLKNVTPSTLIWYRVAFKNYRAALGEDVPLPTKAALQQFVITQRYLHLLTEDLSASHQKSEGVDLESVGVNNSYFRPSCRHRHPYGVVA